ncbi:DUF1801 domain-containing protein [Parvularcula marina]|uniref:DUF1801 domain-containing protein n=2 Tax=Parvularcula marina TaxID=2292771 RepID=UPI00351674C2
MLASPAHHSTSSNPMSGNQTVPTDVDPKEFLSAVEHDRRREDGFALLEMMNRVTKLKPVMWGPSIIGYGQYHYKYESGREGDFFYCGFSPRKANMSLYFIPGYGTYSEFFTRLGKHKTGASCVYINKLADIDMSVLEELTATCVKHMKSKYG